MLGEFLALLASFCWALSAILYKKALEHERYILVNLLRSLFASIFLGLILVIMPYQLLFLSRNEFILLVFAALIGPVIGDTLYFIGLKKIGVSRTQSISSSYPLYSMLLAAAFLHENITFTIFIGALLIVVGIILLTPIKNEGYNLNFLIATPVLAGFFWSIALVTFKLVLNNNFINPIFAAFINRIATLPFLFFTAIAVKEFNQARKLTRAEIIFIVVGGVLGLGLGGMFVFLSLSLTTASKAIPLSSISPFFTLILAFFYAKEKLEAKIIIGTMLVVTGVFLLTLY
ncbi:DMT family transporter [Candidatus Bathyarchaeota archaeon]|nr:DMT family transporter [Candidatus Bathyarchaeota archaeon]